MNKTRSSLLLLTLLVFVSACNGSNRIRQFASEDNGKTGEVRAGDTFTVTLISNLTTGYQWDIEQLDPAILQQVGEAAYEPDNKKGDMVGAGGKETFTFKAQANGQTDLTLIYHRRWEKGIQPIETFKMTIVVN